MDYYQIGQRIRRIHLNTAFPQEKLSELEKKTVILKRSSSWEAGYEFITAGFIAFLPSSRR